MRTGGLIAIAIWVALYLFTVGTTFAYWQGEFPSNSHRGHAAFAWGWSLATPVATLLLPFVSAFWQHGWRLPLPWGDYTITGQRVDELEGHRPCHPRMK